ncbi:MAG: DEAD/DEAH box helicase [Patescibacteria group bacterium]|jgi:ATP-dependent RNA helicase RhlE
MAVDNSRINSISGFTGLGIAPSLLNVFAKLHYEKPTPIQQQAIPVAISGKDVVGIAQTGTGKTLAFGVPMLQRLNQLHGKGLVVVPTRELAQQVDETLHSIASSFGLKTAVLIGGASMGLQLRALSRNPHIIVATPGRLNDILQQRKIRLDKVKVVVLDEADRMLDMGFAPQIQKIFNALPDDRQTMLFSATMPHDIFKMATNYMKLPIRIEVAPPGTTIDRVSQEIYIIPAKSKGLLTEKILNQYHGPTLIFTRTKHGAKKLAQNIRNLGHSAVEIHSNRSLGQRREAMQGFKIGKYRVLIATDIASRGIDVAGIELVLNYDLPMNSEDYIHRIGRTARAGAGGHAISLVTPDQRKEVRDIERLMKKTLPVAESPDVPKASFAAPAPYYTSQRRGRGSRSGGFGRRQGMHRKRYVSR